jgi:hypothetical protein
VARTLQTAGRPELRRRLLPKYRDATEIPDQKINQFALGIFRDLATDFIFGGGRVGASPRPAGLENGFWRKWENDQVIEHVWTCGRITALSAIGFLPAVRVSQIDPFASLKIRGV